MAYRSWSFMVVLLCLILAQTSMAQDATASFTIVSFKVRDIKTNEPLAAFPVTFHIKNLNTGYEEQNADYIDPDGLLIHKFTPGNWNVQLRIDDASTEQVDYFAEQVINIQPDEPLLNKSFYVRPVGVVTGSVVDAQGKPAVDADLDFNCKTESNIGYPTGTDKFGAFRTELPPGKCKISAAYRGDVGSVTVDARQGALSTATIKVGRRISTWLLILIPLLIGVLGYILYRFIKRHVTREVAKEIKKEIHKEAKEKKAEEKEEAKVQEEPKKEAEKEGKEGLNPRARDIMKTLNERELQIVQYLLTNNHAGTQANLRNHTGIPKTSLVRSFQSLEDKKVLSVEKIGKMKKVKLTDWFLGEE